MKKTIQQTLILVTALWISSCGADQEKSTSIVAKEAEGSSASVELTLTPFKGLPKEIDGCACYFSENEEQFKNNEYLFAAGFDSVAFVSVGNKPVRLRLLSTERAPDTFGDHDHVDVYTSERYKVTVDIKYKKATGYETWWNEVTVTIESKEGQTLIKKMVGECGC